MHQDLRTIVANAYTFFENYIVRLFLFNLYFRIRQDYPQHDERYQRYELCKRDDNDDSAKNFRRKYRSRLRLYPERSLRKGNRNVGLQGQLRTLLRLSSADSQKFGLRSAFSGLQTDLQKVGVRRQKTMQSSVRRKFSRYQHVSH